MVSAWLLPGLSTKALKTFSRHRYDQTVQGYSSDTERWELFVNAMEIGIETSAAASCPTYLPFVLEQRFDPNYIESVEALIRTTCSVPHYWRLRIESPRPCFLYIAWALFTVVAARVESG